MTAVRNRIAPLGLRPDVDARLVEELAAHLEDRYNELRSGGLDDAEAFRAAMAELEDVYPLKAALPAAVRRPAPALLVPGDSRPGNVFNDLWRDLRYAFRAMRAAPGFAAIVMATLALGIGANTTVFTIVNTLVLNPLPVRDAKMLKGITAYESKDLARTPVPISYPDWQDYRDRNHVFESVAGFAQSRIVTMQEGGAPERVFLELVTSNYFSTLGLRPSRGRFFFAGEDKPESVAVAVLSYGTWKSRFGAREDIVGRNVRLNGVVYTVIGVAPERFIGVNAVFGPDFWAPVGTAARLVPNELGDALTDRGKALLTGIARLKQGVPPSQAQADLDTIASALARDYPAGRTSQGIAVRPVVDVAFGPSNTRGLVAGSAVLMGVVAVVLLIACSNVANLLLARSAARRQEMSVRLALGASRSRLVRQLLTESLVFALLSGVVGFGLGYEGLRAVFGVLPSAANFATPKFDANVFAFALAISIGAAFVFGLAPAFESSRRDVAETLKEQARTAGRGARRVSIANGLVVAQVAFSFALLVTAALFLRSLGRAYAMDPGFQTSHLAVIMTSPAQDGYSPAQTAAFYRAARERVAGLRGVAAVSWASNLPLWARPVNGFDVEGRERRSESDRLRSVLTVIDVGYFRASGVRLQEGREFAETDGESAPPVAIVNDKMARDYWPAGAIGKRIQLPGESAMRQIVGVARTANYTSWGEPPQNCVYVPLQQKHSDAMTLFIRTTGDPREIVTPARSELNALAPRLVLSVVRTGDEIVYGGLFMPRMAVALLTAFGALALGLATIGLYGILAYSVHQRRREIGVRLALGATPSRVQSLVLKEGMALVGVGVGIGAVAGVGVARLLGGLLFGVSAADPISLAGAAAALSAVALVACYLPARSATRVDPIAALRSA